MANWFLHHLWAPEVRDSNPGTGPSAFSVPPVLRECACGSPELSVRRSGTPENGEAEEASNGGQIF